MTSARIVRRLLVMELAWCVGPTARASLAQCPDGSPPPCAAQPTRAFTAPARNSVAVLYFDNLSPDTADAYLADGLTEEIIDRLGHLDRLEVKSRHAVRPYHGREAPEPIRLARALHVASLVSGSVRRSGSRLKVTVELVRGADGVRAWGEPYERTDGDVFAIEAEIARAVATAIGGRLLPRERVTLVTRPTGSATAYDHYLRGMYDLERRSPAGAARGIAEFEAALRLDPKFAKARAGLAWGYATSYDWTWPLLGLSRDSLLARGLAAVELASAGDSTNAEAWRIRGLLLENPHADTFAGAATAVERSLAL